MNRNLILEFEDFLNGRNNLSINTKKSYLLDINQIFIYVENKDIIKWILVEENIKNYVYSLEKNNYSNASISRKISTINLFTKFLYKSKYIDNIIKFDISLSSKSINKSKDNIIDIFSREEISSILDFKGNDFLSLRDKSIFEIVYAIGIKASDCINLKTDDVNLEIGYIKYKNTSNNYVTTPLNRESLQSLKKYIDKRKELNLENEYLFLSSSGNSITRQSFWKIFKKRQKQLGLKKDLNPTSYRNSLAVHLLEDGIQPSIVQEILGLKSILSLKSYINKADSNKTNKILSINHPRNKLE